MTEAKYLPESSQKPDKRPRRQRFWAVLSRSKSSTWGTSTSLVQTAQSSSHTQLAANVEDFLAPWRGQSENPPPYRVAAHRPPSPGSVIYDGAWNTDRAAALDRLCGTDTQRLATSTNTHSRLAQDEPPSETVNSKVECAEYLADNHQAMHRVVGSFLVSPLSEPMVINETQCSNTMSDKTASGSTYHTASPENGVGTS